MKYYLVGYVYERGFGRMFFGTSSPTTDKVIMEWENIINENAQTKCSVISISEIDGPIDPK